MPATMTILCRRYKELAKSCIKQGLTVTRYIVMHYHTAKIWLKMKQGYEQSMRRAQCHLFSCTETLPTQKQSIQQIGTSFKGNGAGLQQLRHTWKKGQSLRVLTRRR